MGNLLINVCNFIIKGVGSLISMLLSILPHSPFTYLDNSPVAKYLGYINWIIPVSSFIAIGSAWLVSIGLFYIYQTVLRWVKVIE